MLEIYARTFMVATRTDPGQPLDTASGSLVRLFERLRDLTGIGAAGIASR